MKKALKVSSLLLALTMAMSMTGCADKGADTSKEKKSDGKKEITISHFSIEEQRAQSVDSDGFFTMLENYEKENPDVKITQSVLEQADYATKIQAQAAVNEVPDVFYVKGSWFNNFVSNGLLSPLDDKMNSYEKKDAFRPGIFDASTVKDKNYGLPTQFSVTSIVYYNQPMWAEIGYDKFPDNWDDLYAAIGKFNEKGVTPFAFGNKDKWPAESCILSALGDRYTGTEWTNSIIANDGKAKFTDKEFVSALDNMGKLAEVKAFNPDFNAIQNNPADEYYCAGDAAATIEGFWALAYILENATEEVKNNTSVAILPPVDGAKGKANTTSGGCGWYCGVSGSLDEEQTALATDFLFSIYGYDYSDYVTKNFGMISPCVTDEVDPASFPKLTQNYIKFMSDIELTPIYDILMEGAVIETMNSGVQEILNGTSDSQTVAAAIQAEQDKVKK